MEKSFPNGAKTEIVAVYFTITGLCWHSPDKEYVSKNYTEIQGQHVVTSRKKIYLSSSVTVEN